MQGPRRAAERAGVQFVVLFSITLLTGLLTAMSGRALWVSWWLCVIATLVVATLVAFVRARSLSKAEGREQLAEARPGSPRGAARQLPKAAKRAVQLWTLALIAWLVVLLMILPAWITTTRLGDHKGTAVATQTYVHPRYRASTLVTVDFVTQSGMPVRTTLLAVGQDDRIYKPGIAIFYDRRHPSLAIAEADYADGSTHNLLVVGGITVVFAAWTYLTFSYVRRGPRAI